jgi:hypothetical protein
VLKLLTWKRGFEEERENNERENQGSKHRKFFVFPISILLTPQPLHNFLVWIRVLYSSFCFFGESKLFELKNNLLSSCPPSSPSIVKSAYRYRLVQTLE